MLRLISILGEAEELVTATLMSEWMLFEDRAEALAGSVVGYAVYDALGVRLGHVSGWVADAEDHVQMLKVIVPGWSATSEYLVPVGAVTLIGDTKSVVQLRDLTKQSIGRLCFRYKSDLPEHRLLLSLQRHFPAPRASVMERLHRMSNANALSSHVPTWTRLSELSLS